MSLLVVTIEIFTTIYYTSGMHQRRKCQGQQNCRVDVRAPVPFLSGLAPSYLDGERLLLSGGSGVGLGRDGGAGGGVSVVGIVPADDIAAADGRRNSRVERVGAAVVAARGRGRKLKGKGLVSHHGGNVCLSLGAHSAALGELAQPPRDTAETMGLAAGVGSGRKHAVVRLCALLEAAQGQGELLARDEGEVAHATGGVYLEGILGSGGQLLRVRLDHRVAGEDADDA